MMSGFLKYLFSEVEQKRLSRVQATQLLRDVFEFSGRGTAPGAAALHPLVHRNTSDLSEQRFSTRFSGQEFFLADHRVHGERVLPGAVHLELVRAAVLFAAGSEASGW